MNQEHIWIEEGAEVAPPAWMKPVNRYGSVEGLEDEELASPAELERAYYKELWGPVLLIPAKKSYSPAYDMSGDVDYNAFASVDFDRLRPEFDKARYKVQKLNEQLKDVMITVSILNEKIQKKAKYKLLKWVKEGRIEPDQIKDCRMWMLARFYLRALRLKKEITRLQIARRKRQRQATEKWLEDLG